MDGGMNGHFAFNQMIIFNLNGATPYTSAVNPTDGQYVYQNRKKGLNFGFLLRFRYLTKKS